MIKKGQMIELEITPNRKKYYGNIGYDIKDDNGSFLVAAEDLRRTETGYVDFLCDDCGDMITKRFSSHFDNLTKKPKPDRCLSCRTDKVGISLHKDVEVLKKTDKRQLLQEIIKLESRGYECAHPVQTLSCKLDQFDDNYSTFYLVTMRKIKNEEVGV